MSTIFSRLQPDYNNGDTDVGEFRHGNIRQPGCFQGSKPDPDMVGNSVYTISRRFTYCPSEHVDCNDEQFISACRGKNSAYTK